MKNRNWIFGIIIFLVLINLTSCASSGADATPSGFISGFIHGFVIIFALIGKLFGMDVGLYAQNNTGFFYWLGFIIGIGGFGGGGIFGGSRRRRRD